MKRLLLATLLLPMFSFAQSVDVKDVSTGEDTTIEIRKGKKEDLKKAAWETNDGEADVEGEPGATRKDAEKSWKTACDDWKKEFRADNKENKIISMSCGTKTCTGEAGNKVCTSKAKYKVKTRTE